jgi:hypothetical protein
MRMFFKTKNNFILLTSLNDFSNMLFVLQTEVNNNELQRLDEFKP